jgi:hypothetical protein
LPVTALSAGGGTGHAGAPNSLRGRFTADLGQKRLDTGTILFLSAREVGGGRGASVFAE